MDDLAAGFILGLLLAALAVATGLGLAWLVGLFNPIGYLGIPPWRVPPEARRNPLS